MVRRGFAALLVAVLSVLVTVRAAHADPPGAHTVPVAVLAFDSEDAEEQADAITGALRSRVRNAQAWSLVDITQSLGMLTAAMKCPARPTPECQLRISEQVKAERYVWGFVSKGPTPSHVTAEVHLYQRGKPDIVLKETYADNLKDANDDALRAIAERLVERLGTSTVGVLVVRSASGNGEVVIDGEKHVALDKGSVRVEVSAGSHSVEFSPQGGSASKRNVIVAAGRETVTEFGRVVAAEAPSGLSRAKTRKLIGGITMGVGVVLAGVATYEVVHYFDLQSQGDAEAAKTPKTDPPRPCREVNPRCSAIDRDSKVASGVAVGVGAGALVALGVGAYFFFSDPGGNNTTATSSRSKTRVLPTVTRDAGGLVVVGAF
jgi:hypothetical protein